MASRSSRRAATQAADTTPAALVESVTPVDVTPAPELEPTPAPEPIPERQYALEIRLANAALSGDSAYHVTWPESRIRALLAGEMTWIPAPVRAHLPGQAAPNAARFVYIQNIAEIVIHGWPQD